MRRLSTFAQQPAEIQDQHRKHRANNQDPDQQRPPAATEGYDWCAAMRAQRWPRSRKLAPAVTHDLLFTSHTSIIVICYPTRNIAGELP
ncbi:MAG: hypothetical protein H8E44_23825 [Planctomycetes bacterium]|nr:hypothetical protein [Planctomycetota bacterium]MBL7043787.1 hypothetical protein [Pirellulaceae bacterium]